MNGQMLELWGRWLTTAMQGQSQMEMVNGWWLRGMQNVTAFDAPSTMFWGMPGNRSGDFLNFSAYQQVWEPVLKMQQLCMQWMQMVPRTKYEELSKQAEVLESKLQEQARTIDRLREMLNETSGDNNVVVAQLQDLIGQQSQQFKQVTQSISDYIRSGAEEVHSKK